MPVPKRTPPKRSSVTRNAPRSASRQTGARALIPARRRQLSRDLGRIVTFVAGAPTPRRRDLVAEVDFPTFVAGLIDGVFQAIVDASVQQMEAYGDLVKGVARWADAFAGDTVAADRARDWLSRKYTDLLNDKDDSDDEDGKASSSKRQPRRRKSARLTNAQQRALVGAVTLLGIERLLLTTDKGRTPKESQ